MSHPTPPVVVAVDHSPQAAPAARAGALEAARRRTGLRLVHVDRPVHPGWLTSARTADDLRILTRRAAEDLLARTAATLTDILPGAQITSVVRTGDPAHLLVEETRSTTLLVLGGRSGDWLGGPGATAARVVSHAAAPVLVLPDEDDRALVEGHSVVVGIAGGPGEDAVVHTAFEEADARGRELVAVHAWTEPTLAPTYQTIGPLIDWAGVRDEEERLLAEALAGWGEKWPDVEVRPALVKECRARALRAAAAAATAELLVVGRRHRGPVTGLGSTTRALLHSASCPLLVVPLPARPGDTTGGSR